MKGFLLLTLALATLSEGNGQSDFCSGWVQDYLSDYYTYDDYMGSWYDVYDMPIETPFRCNDGKCTPPGYRCDGEHDCDWGEDESTCEDPTPTEAPTEQTGQVCRSIMENKRGNAASGWVGEMNNIGKSIEDCGQAVLNAGPYVAAYMHGSSCYGYTEMFTAADLVEYEGTTLCLLTFTIEGNGQSDGGCPTWINDYVGQFYTYDEEKGAWYDDFGTIEVPFTCNDGKCIPEHWRCDGGPDCDGGEDESTCEAPTTISTTEAITPAKTTPAPFVMPEGEVNTSFLGGECIKAGNEGTAVCMQLCIDQGCYGIDWNKSARPWMNCRCWLHRKEPKTIKNNNKIDHYRNPQYD